jgi:hypothetical protein
MSQPHSVSVSGVGLAATAGWSAWFGAILIRDLWKLGEQVPDYQKIFKRAFAFGVGGLFFTLGAYAFVPRFVRNVWMA